MKHRMRSIMRAACRLRDRYEEHQRTTLATSSTSIDGSVRPFLDQASRFERLLSKAQSRGFDEAARRLRVQFARSLESANQALDPLCRSLRADTPHLPTLRNLVEELVATQDEFGSVEWDTAERRISVTTDPITLEGIPLGSYRIDLLLDEIGHKDPANWFLIEALEPNPPASNEEVTHPHVEHGRVCAGDAWHPINNALNDGRLSEFFAVVRSVLETYNPDSPYVKLEDWDGISCSDCACVMSDDDRFWCEGCDQDYCGECISYCHCCDTSFCFGCLSTCDLCDERACEACTSTCTICGEACCNTCLEDGLCPTCQQEEDNSDDECEDTQTIAAPSKSPETLQEPCEDQERSQTRQPQVHGAEAA